MSVTETASRHPWATSACAVSIAVAKSWGVTRKGDLEEDELEEGGDDPPAEEEGERRAVLLRLWAHVEMRLMKAVRAVRDAAGGLSPALEFSLISVRIA